MALFMVTTDGAFAVAWISGMIVFLQTQTHTHQKKAVQACKPRITHTSAGIHTMHQTSFCTDMQTL